MAESFRKIDMRAETKLAEFMDRNFYSKLRDKNNNPIVFERKTNAESQLDGIDVELTVENRRFLIDEKASLYYSNAMIPTFAFEIDSMQKGHKEPVEGWFLNNNLSTEYYMLIWPNIKCEEREKQWIRKDIGNISSTDFTILEAMLVEKQALINEIGKHGYDKAFLMSYAERVRRKMSGADCAYDEKLDESIKIVYSGQLAEKPINAVIRKELIIQASKAVYLISEDGYAQIRRQDVV